MDKDYPAAHSTDVMWFATDRDGHVAAFETVGWGDAPPNAAYVGELDGRTRLRFFSPPSLELWTLWQGKKRRTEAVVDLEGLELPIFEPPRHVPSDGPRPSLFFLRTADAVQEDVRQERAFVFGATRGVAVFYQYDRRPARAAIDGWHERGLCLGCFLAGDVQPDGCLLLAEHGFVMYSDLCYTGDYESIVFADAVTDWLESFPGGYGRLALPADPSRLGDLRPAIQEPIARVQFDELCFLETPHMLAVTAGGSIEAQRAVHRQGLEKAWRMAEEADRGGSEAKMNAHLVQVEQHERALQRLSRGRSAGKRENGGSGGEEHVEVERHS